MAEVRKSTKKLTFLQMSIFSHSKVIDMFEYHFKPHKHKLISDIFTFSWKSGMHLNAFELPVKDRLSTEAYFWVFGHIFIFINCNISGCYVMYNTGLLTQNIFSVWGYNSHSWMFLVKLLKFPDDNSSLVYRYQNLITSL